MKQHFNPSGEESVSPYILGHSPTNLKYIHAFSVSVDTHNSMSMAYRHCRGNHQPSHAPGMSLFREVVHL